MMLRHLKLENVAVIEKIEVEFDNGFNCLTGETAAGKSIIIDGINMVLGARTSKDIIRTDCEKAIVEAVFIDNNFQSEDKALIIRREIFTDGHNLCKINGEFTSLTQLKEQTENLINIHGQHDNQSFMNPGKHIEILDTFAKNEIEKNEYKEALASYNTISRQISDLESAKQEKFLRLDTLKLQLEEIEGINPQVGEDEALEIKRETASNIDKIISNLSSSYNLLYQDDNAALDKISAAYHDLENIMCFNPDFENAKYQLEIYKNEVSEISHEIGALLDKYSQDAPNLDGIEERLHNLFTLKRKYGVEISDILNYRDNIKNEINLLENSEESLEELKKEQNIKKEILDQKIEKLFETRKKTADILKENIAKELAYLQMPKTTFDVDFKNFDNLEFLISTNIGEAPKPLAKIASGGELSRISLAIMSILAASEDTPTMIFDEIDTGISGRAAQAVAEKLARIGKEKQIFAITHLAQIASMADNHYRIIKEIIESKTVSTLEKLDDKGRTAELARIIGGAKITDITLQHAKEMLELAKKQKELI